MQFCWKMLSGWEQGWLNTPLSVLDKKWGITGFSPAQLIGSRDPRSILLFCIKLKSCSYLLSILLFVHFAVFIFSVPSVLSLSPVPAIKKMPMLFWALAPGGQAEHPNGVQGHQCGD